MIPLFGLLQVYIEQIEKKRYYRQLDRVNKECMQYLNLKGQKGDIFLRKAPRLSPWQRELIEAKVKTNGEVVEDLSNIQRKFSTIFVTTGGGYALNGNNCLKA